jgi:uncharacterized protein YcbX
MQIVGKVESLWRYPVKSMRGEELSEAFLGVGGVRGDRLYAFSYSRAPVTFPYLTGREKPEMLRYKATYEEGKACVETPAGERLVIHDQALIDQMAEGLREGDQVGLLSSDRALADCQPISLFSIQTVRQLAGELGFELDKRRFRANIYIDLATQDGFGEDSFVGHRLRIGSDAIVEVIERDQRCKMITLDPETTLAEPKVIRQVAHAHDGKAGIYGSVLVEGPVRLEDQIVILS